MAPDVTIIGATGDLGFGLAVRWARAGVPVTIGSRDAGRAARPPSACRGRPGRRASSGADERGGRRRADVVVMSVPFAGQAATYKSIAEHLQPGQLVIDATVPLATAPAASATRMLGVPQGSAAQQAAELVPDGRRRRQRPAHRQRLEARPSSSTPLDEDVLVCGDRKDPKAAAIELIERIDGLRAIDVGRLEISRITESMTALLISVNIKHKTHAGVRLTGV